MTMNRRPKRNTRSDKPSRSGSRFSYNYKKRSDDEVKARATQSAGGYDTYILDNFPTFKIQANHDHILRVLPPSGENSYYGYDLYVHAYIGEKGNEGSYPCLKSMGKGECPLCEEYERARREETDDEYTRQFKPSKKVLIWVVDRENPSEGPQVWVAPWTADRDLATACRDKVSGETILIDDPEEGYDIQVKRGGAKEKWAYLACHPGRRSSPLSKSVKEGQEWLDFITENPLEETVKWFDYEHMEKKVQGVSVEQEEDDEEDERDYKKKSKPKTRAESSVSKRKKKYEEDLDDLDEEEEEDDLEEDDYDEEEDDLEEEEEDDYDEDDEDEDNDYEEESERDDEEEEEDAEEEEEDDYDDEDDYEPPKKVARRAVKKKAAPERRKRKPAPKPEPETTKRRTVSKKTRNRRTRD